MRTYQTTPSPRRLATRNSARGTGKEAPRLKARQMPNSAASTRARSVLKAGAFICCPSSHDVLGCQGRAAARQLRDTQMKIFLQNRLLCLEVKGQMIEPGAGRIHRPRAPAR